MNTNIANISGLSDSVTMTSREIAELTEKRHDNVKRTIESCAERGAISLPQIEEVKIQRERREETVGVYKLDKRSSLIVVAQLSPEFTARIVDRWQELEAKATSFDPSSLSRIDILKMAIDSEEGRLQAVAQVQKLETVVATQAPKVEALERIATSDGSLCLTDAAKTLQIQPRKFTQLLQEKGWIYRRPMGAGWLAYQERIQQGLMEHKVTVGEKGDGTEWTATQPRITPKGLTKLAQAMGGGLLQ